MKKLLIVIKFALVTGVCFSQTTEYFTTDWIKTTDKSKASYYREITYSGSGSPVGVVKDHYMNGALQWQGMIAGFDNAGKEIFNGWCTWYNPNGLRSKLSYFNNGRLDSTTYYWDENGALIQEEDYSNGVLNGAWISYYPDGKTHYIGLFKNGEMQGGKYLAYDEDGNASVTLEDNFIDNHNNWKLANEKNYSISLSAGKITIKTAASQRLGSYVYLPLPDETNFSLETTVHFEKGTTNSGHGLIWGFQDWDNYDYFMVTANGYFQAGSFIKGINAPSIKWTYSPSLQKGKAANHIKVLKEGDEYLFLANTQLLGRAKYIKMAGKDVGMAFNDGEKSVYFEKLLVKYDVNPATAPIAKEQPNGGWLGNGSGILVDVNGLIATNFHVVQDAHIIEADFARSGKKYSFSAEVIKTDPVHDLALLKINDKRYDSFKPPALPFGIKTSRALTGSSIFALGYPMADVLGEEIKFTDGRISAGTGIQGDTVTYQISVPIQPGNSGGPLFDQDGNLIGITNARAKLETQNVSYAIKVAWLLQFGGEYIKKPANTIKQKSTEEKVSILSPFIPLIKIK